MNREEILDFVRGNTTSFMATTENGEPRVRAMDTPHIDENGLTFCTGTGKDVCRFWQIPWDNIVLKAKSRMSEFY